MEKHADSRINKENSKLMIREVYDNGNGNNYHKKVLPLKCHVMMPIRLKQYDQKISHFLPALRWVNSSPTVVQYGFLPAFPTMSPQESWILWCFLEGDPYPGPIWRLELINLAKHFANNGVLLPQTSSLSSTNWHGALLISTGFSILFQCIDLYLIQWGSCPCTDK